MDIIVERKTKTIYRENEKVIKLFLENYSKANILNEALRKRVDTYLIEHGSKANIRVGYGLTECTAASCVTPRYYYKEGGIGILMPDTIYKIMKIGTNE